MSPILTRPVREQLEHDRVIRQLQARYKRKNEVVINPGNEQNQSVTVGELVVYPDLLLFAEGGRRLLGTVEVETGESVNAIEARAEWGVYSKLKVPLHLYVPPACVDAVKRICAEYQILVSELWTYTSSFDQVRFSMVHRAPDAPVVRGAAERAEPARGRQGEAGGRESEARGRQAEAGASPSPSPKPKPSRRPRSPPPKPRRKPSQPPRRAPKAAGSADHADRDHVSFSQTVPFLRLTRDRRGIENTFLMHADRPGDRPRLLYWYRTAPGITLGRLPLDEDAIRTIEEQHPDIDFDWPAILALSEVMTPEDEVAPRAAATRAA